MTTWAVIVIPVILAGLGLSARYAFWRPDIPGVPALMYHYLADDPGRTALPKLRVAPRRFERQMDFLKSRGFRTLCCRDFVRYAGEGVSPPERSVMITFDDGARESLLRAAPVLAERGFCATVFVASDLVGEYNRWDEPKGEPRLDLLDWSELKSLAEAGWEIGSHTRSHANLIRLGDAELVEELAGSKMAIEANLGGEVTALAYPYGLADDRVRTAARTAGYRLGLGTCPGKLDLGDDPLDLPRIIVKRRDTLLDLRLKLGKGRSSL